MTPLLLIAAAFAVQAGPAAPSAAPAGDDVRINQLVIYEGDKCPPSTDDEIVICVVQGSRYRIPENLRDSDNPASNSWANRANELSYVGRSGIGSCSTTGPGGQIGCFDQLINQAVAERSGRDDVNWARLIEVARQERLGRIDAESEEIERNQRNVK